MIDVRQVQLDKTKRSIVISDIHANLKLFKKLLNKLHYTIDDYLFINGDLCEKGPKSLEVVEFVQNLCEQSDRVFVTKGNCDVLHRDVFDESAGIMAYMNRQKHSILNEMLEKQSKTKEDFTNLKEIGHFYRQHFHNELNWIDSLPIAYETEAFIVIHAGIENIEDWHETEESFALHTDAFYEKDHIANKTVIVGHWPVVNYRATLTSSHNPVIDLDKKVIALDGGNQIKKDGQLNALIIENNNYSYTYVDDLAYEMIVRTEHIDSTDRLGTVTYPNYEMQTIKKEEYFTLCKNSNLGIEQWIKNEYLLTDSESIRCKTDLSTTFLSVTQSEQVWIIDNDCEGFSLVKKGTGEVGWIPKSCL
ncbi:metallophosphoesterase [Psychrobacillus sp.]|uniref:metallophosphoesterase n=1 Tax=Psychrobacillus sp. TaxID=1871623 RepID=UPI0028BD80CD|nr:metallophosphoesterase [Psychrobacillus sp.]